MSKNNQLGNEGSTGGFELVRIDIDPATGEKHDMLRRSIKEYRDLEGKVERLVSYFEEVEDEKAKPLMTQLGDLLGRWISSNIDDIYEKDYKNVKDSGKESKHETTETNQEWHSIDKSSKSKGGKGFELVSKERNNEAGEKHDGLRKSFKEYRNLEEKVEKMMRYFEQIDDEKAKPLMTQLGGLLETWMSSHQKSDAYSEAHKVASSLQSSMKSGGTGFILTGNDDKVRGKT